MNMIAIPLQSGSSGNSIYVEGGGVRVLIDAGISGVQAEKRLAAHGRDIRGVDALIISHDHADHVKSAGVFHRKYGMPVYMSQLTWKASSVAHMLGEIADLRHFRPGEEIEIGQMLVESIPTAHDGVDGAAFVLSSGGQRLGVLTDLGHVFDGLGGVIEGLDAVFLESNYDPDMLRVGPYPPYVKERIKGSGGHLSNQESASLIKTFGKRLKWACLSHLSENNNHPSRAMDCHRETVGSRTPLFTASRRECSGIFTV